MTADPTDGGWAPVQQPQAPAADGGWQPVDTQQQPQESSPLDVGRNFVAPYEGAWDKLKEDFGAWGKSQDEQVAAAKGGVFSWDSLKADFRSKLITGKTLWDAATSTLTLPFAGLVNAGIVKPGGWLLGHAVFGPNVDREKTVTSATNAVADALVAAMPSKGLVAARGLGVLGDAPKPLSEGTPAEAAAEATKPVMVSAEGMMPPAENPEFAAEARKQTEGTVARVDASVPMPRTTGDVIPLDGPSSVPAPSQPPKSGVPMALDKAGNIRLDLIDSAGADALDVIRQAAKEAGGKDAFPEARRGEIPLGQVDALNQVMGMAPGELDVQGVGRRLTNDATVRTYIQAMIQSAQDVAAAAKQAKQTGALDDLMSVQRLRMRNSALLEQVAGLTAEWGRTGNVFQEFTDQVKTAQDLGRFLQAKKGESVEDLRNLVDAIADLDPRTDLPQFLNNQRKPGFWDKLIFYRNNALLSGLFSHVKYAATMATYALYDAGVVTPLAAGIGKARALLGRGDAERVFAGEAGARLYGYVMGVPKAFIEAYESTKSGLRVPSGRRIASGLNPYTQQAPIEGPVGTIVGLPSRVISGLHAFVYSLGRRAELEAQAYRDAATTGYSVFSPEFWNHQRGLAMYPTEKMMDEAEANGDRLTFTSDLGETGLTMQRALRKSRIGQLVFPFTRVPWNIAKAAQEGTPLAYLDPKMREALTGKGGKIAQDTQIARLIAGSAVGAMAIHWAMRDLITDNGPVDEKEHRVWALTHKPYSVRIGDEWVDSAKFVGLGPIMAAAATLVGVAHSVSEEQYQEGANRLAHSVAHFLEDPMGASGLYDAIKATTDNQGFLARYANDFGTSFLPYSTLLGQTASAHDKYIRETQTFLDAIKNKIVGERETLLPVRDWSGMPIANDHAGLDAVFAARAVNTDPVDLEMQRLNYLPARPAHEIGGAPLTPEQYDYYANLCGVYTRNALEHIVTAPAWGKTPPGIRVQILRSTVETQRAAARLQTQGRWPDLIEQGVKLQVQRILNGPQP